MEWSFVSKVMSLHFSMLSRLVIAFLPRSKHLLIAWLQPPSTVILEPKKTKSVTVSIVSPCICHEVMGPDLKWSKMIFILECWALKDWCFWIVMLEKTLVSLLDSKEIKPVNSKGNKSWIFDTEVEAPILWPPVEKSWLIGKDPDSGKNWEQEKRTTEYEMFR